MKGKKSFQALMDILLAASVLLVTCVACGGEAPETAPPTPAATATPSASEHLDTGLDYLEQEEPEQARAEFEEALRLDPGYALAHYNLGRVHYQQGELDLAEAAFKEAIENDPELAAAHTNLGVVYADQGRYAEAIAEYETAIELDPDDDMAHYNLAGSYYDQGQLDAALAEYQEAIRIDPENADAHHNLARIHYEQGDLDQALAEWQRSAELEPEDSMTYNNIGRVYLDQGRLDEAADALNQAIELDPDNALPHFNLALVYRDLGQMDEAIAQLEVYLDIIPPDDPNREIVEQAIAEFRGTAEDGTTEIENATGGYSLLYPEGMVAEQEGTRVNIAASQAGLDAVSTGAIDQAIQDGPIVMADSTPLDDLLASLDLDEAAEPADILEAVAESLEADTGEILTGTVNDYPAALAGITGRQGETDYQGILVFTSVEERGIALTSISTPDQWSAFEPTFTDILDTIRFFEPE
jgi:type IV pilus biogenesis/stability protein PilW